MIEVGRNVYGSTAGRQKFYQGNHGYQQADA